MYKNLEKVKNKIESYDGYFVLDFHYDKNNKLRVTVKDKNGYIYDAYYLSLMSGIFSFVNPSNTYSLQNIDIWLKNNKKTFHLCEKNKYINSHTKLSFYCNICHENFQLTWTSIFIIGQDCPICNGQHVGIKNSLLYINPELCIEWSHKNEISPKDVSQSSNKKVLWNCSNCGFEWIASIINRNKNKRGCPSCSGRISSDKNNLFILFPELLEEWNYSKNNGINIDSICYSSNKKYWWFCKICGNNWIASPNNRTRKLKSGCSKCKMSKGELKISDVLKKLNINYINQKRFSGCCNKRTLPFDFGIQNYFFDWILIEYNGIQHYKILRNNFLGGEENLLSIEFRDSIKTKYCQDNNIPLLRIPYWDFNNIEKILTEYFQKLETSYLK